MTRENKTKYWLYIIQELLLHKGPVGEVAECNHLSLPKRNYGGPSVSKSGWPEDSVLSNAVFIWMTSPNSTSKHKYLCQIIVKLMFQSSEQWYIFSHWHQKRVSLLSPDMFWLKRLIKTFWPPWVTIATWSHKTAWSVQKRDYSKVIIR